MTQPPYGESGGHYPPRYSGQSSYPQQQYPQQPPAQSPPADPYPPPNGSMPSYGAQPPYGSEPSYGAQPPYGSEPPYGNERQYGNEVPYGSRQPYDSQPWPGGGPASGYPSNPAADLSQLKPRRSPFRLVTAIGGPVLALGVIGFLIYAFFLGGGPDAVTDAFEDATDDEVPEAGECITEESLTAEETTVVPCADPTAAWLTLGLDGQVSETDFTFSDVEEFCQAFPTTGYVLWIGEVGRFGDVVCLEEVNPE